MPDTSKESRTTIEIALMIAKEMYKVVMSEEGDFFAVPKEGPKIALRLGNREFSRRIMRAFAHHHGDKRGLDPKVVSQITAMLEADAEDEARESVHFRYAEVDGVTYVDIGDHSGKAIEVSSSGWQIVTRTPVNFRRGPLTLPLPLPADTEGDIFKLFDLVRIEKQKEPILIAWLVCAFFPNLPSPIASFDGEKGTGKSRSLFYSGKVIDPNSAPLRSMPRDGEKWVEAMLGGYFIPLDNISRLSEEQSNQICRATTGTSDVRRSKYTDDDLKVFNFKRQLGFNGISILGIREDLEDRLLHFETQEIPSHLRRTENELNAVFDENSATIFRGLLDLVVEVKKVLPTLNPRDLPRMADFGKILLAIDSILGTDGFTEYLYDMESHSRTALASEPFLILLRDTVNAPFHGDAATLHKNLVARSRTGGYSFSLDEVPRRAAWVTTQLKRFAGSLRRAGWKIEDLGNRNHAKVKMWRIEPPVVQELPPPQPLLELQATKKAIVNFAHLSEFY